LRCSSFVHEDPKIALKKNDVVKVKEMHEDWKGLNDRIKNEGPLIADKHKKIHVANF
jgi:hypothetical protein